VVSLRSIYFYKIDRIPSFDIRPARNALKPVRGEFNNLIHHTMLTLTQRTLHGRRVFDILFLYLSLWAGINPAATFRFSAFQFRIRFALQRVGHRADPAASGTGTVARPTLLGGDKAHL
jgi:hypothetical protein